MACFTAPQSSIQARTTALASFHSRRHALHRAACPVGVPALPTLSVSGSKRYQTPSSAVVCKATPASTSSDAEVSKLEIQFQVSYSGIALRILKFSYPTPSSEAEKQLMSKPLFHYQFHSQRIARLEVDWHPELYSQVNEHVLVATEHLMHSSSHTRPRLPFSQEVYFDGGPHYGDLILNLALGITGVWMPLTLAAIFRCLFLRYRFTNKRFTLLSGLSDSERRDFDYSVSSCSMSPASPFIHVTECGVLSWYMNIDINVGVCNE